MRIDNICSDSNQVELCGEDPSRDGQPGSVHSSRWGEHSDRPRLRIALIANTNLPVPPYYGYGGTQRGVFDFLTEFDRKGHDLTLFAPLSSRVSHLANVSLRGTLPVGLWEPGNPWTLEEKRELNLAYHEYVVQEIARGGFDIVNIRSDSPIFVERLAALVGPGRIVYSLHNVSSMAAMSAIHDTGIHCVAHCNSHRNEYGAMPNIRTILYGINTGDYPEATESLSRTTLEPTLPVLKELKRRGQDYLLHLSCIRPEKGQKTAIELARKVGIPLIIAGTPERRSGDHFVRYHEAEVLPAVDNETVFYFGNADEEQKKELLRFAKGFLFPSGFEDTRWKEPFGRAPVEAMACGVPVVAFAHGSMVELIDHGVTGYLFRTVSQAASQLRLLDGFDRASIRRATLGRFDKARVADDYETLFYEMRANFERQHDTPTPASDRPQARRGLAS